MENASKALLMTGGVLIALLIIALLVAMFNQAGTFYSGEEEMQKDEQIAKFNFEYEAYNRDDVRGTDLISLLNKVANYNERKSEVGTEGKDIAFQAMTVNIDLGNKNDYSVDGANRLIKKNSYSMNSTKNEFQTSVMNNLNNLISTYGESELLKLSKSIENIDELVNNNKSKKNAVLAYYEYVQLKRAHFKCTKTDYNNKTGRIVKMEFKFTEKFE